MSFNNLYYFKLLLGVNCLVLVLANNCIHYHTFKNKHTHTQKHDVISLLAVIIAQIAKCFNFQFQFFLVLMFFILHWNFLLCGSKGALWSCLIFMEIHWALFGLHVHEKKKIIPFSKHPGHYPPQIFLMSNPAWTSSRNKLLSQEKSWLEHNSAVRNVWKCGGEHRRNCALLGECLHITLGHVGFLRLHKSL